MQNGTIGGSLEQINAIGSTTGDIQMEGYGSC